MPIAILPAILAVGSGGVIGLILGLVGGGGSILAVPLLVYVVGVPSAHIAIGTAALRVPVCWARRLERSSAKPSTDSASWRSSGS